MSALGQKRTRAAQQRWSLFDHLVGDSEQLRWDSEVERFSGFGVDHQLKLGRLLYRQIPGICTPEDAVDVSCRLPERVNGIVTIRDQAA